MTRVVRVMPPSCAAEHAMAPGVHRGLGAVGPVSHRSLRLWQGGGGQCLWMWTVTFMPGTRSTVGGASRAILTGMTCVTFWKLPPVLLCGNRENTAAAPP